MSKRVTNPTTQTFTFNKAEDLLTPKAATFRPLLKKDGTPMNGDEAIIAMATIIDKFEAKGRPVPISDQKFISWVKQFAGELKKGVSSNEIMRRTLVGGGH